MRRMLVLFAASAALALHLNCDSAPAETPAPAPAPRRAVDVDYLMGKFDPSADARFVPVGAPYSDRPGMLLRRETFEAFKAMWEAAQKDGVTLKIISSTRNFQQQKAIWESKWAKTAGQAPEPVDRARVILQYSAMPGASRHHWGTDIDLNDLLNASFSKDGKYANAYTWLSTHAHAYGFCQPYTAGRPSGYREERWHWSYMPLSTEFTRDYAAHVTDAMLTGFKGSETAVPIGIVHNYALGINEACQ